MALVYHGSLSLGACLPLTVTATASASASITGLIVELTGKLQGFLNVSAALALPQITGAVEAAAAVLISLTATPPTISATLQLTAVLGIMAALQIQISGLEAGLALLAELDVILGAAGIHLYSYTGAAGALGSTLAVGTAGGLPDGGPSDICAAVILATTAQPASVSLSAAFGVEVTL